ncbi:hypothetical protein PGB90_004719 [Kerria lacca]
MNENNEDTTSEAYETQQDLQKKLYFMNEQLQLMVQDLPMKYQQRFPNELLCGLAECLLDNTVFGIVEHLMDIQHYTEKQLFKKRLRFIHDHSVRKKAVKDSSLTEEIKNLKILVMNYRYKKKLRNCDKEIIKILDMKRRDQQNVLVTVGVPGFQITNDPQKIQVQIRLLDFIFRLSQMKDRL